MPDFRVAHLTRGKADGISGRFERSPRRLAKQAIKTRRGCLRDGIPLALFATSEAVDDDEDEKWPLGHRGANDSRLRRCLLPLEHHSDVIGRAGFEVDRSDADQFPTFVAEAIELFSATGIHRIVLRPDVDDLVFPGLHVRPPVVLNGLSGKCSTKAPNSIRAARQ